jgi:opacity protein-like surface antigen
MKLFPHFALTLFLATAAQAGNAGYPQPAPAPAYGYAPQPQATYQAPIATAGWTLGVLGGRLTVNEVSQPVHTAFGTVDAELSFEHGWGVVLPLDYHFADGLTLGVSAGYEKAHLGHLTGTLAGITQTLDIDGKLSMVPIMANAGYAVPLSNSLTWNFGGGAGVVHTDVRIAGEAESDVSWDLGFQAFTGLNLSVTPQTIFNLGYRYQLTKETDVDLTSHLVEAGVTFHF